MSEKKFSLAVVAATAAVSFLISGVGGASLAEWLARPMPLVTIAAVGFSGSETQVPVSDTLISATRDSAWIRTYRKFESFGSLEEDYEKIDLVKKRLERGLALVDDWLKISASAFESAGSRLTLDQLGHTPYMGDEIIGNSLIGMARRGELHGVPIALAQLTKNEPVTEVAEDGSAWIIYLEDRNVRFPFGHTQTQTEKAAIRLLAYSFAYGSGANLVHYFKRFQGETNREIRKLINIKDELEKALLPSTKLAVTGAVFNSGRKPLVIKPYALVEVLNDDIAASAKKHLVRIEVLAYGGAPARAEDSQDRERASSGDVVVDAFLPRMTGSGYILVPPNSKVDVKLTSVEQLGAAGTRLRAIYDSNVLRCQVTMLSVTGDELKSDALLFGSSADNDLKDELLGVSLSTRAPHPPALARTTEGLSSITPL